MVCFDFEGGVYKKRLKSQDSSYPVFPALTLFIQFLLRSGRFISTTLISILTTLRRSSQFDLLVNSLIKSYGVRPCSFAKLFIAQNEMSGHQGGLSRGRSPPQVPHRMR